MTEDLIDLIVKRAPDLREAGVLSLSVGEVHVVLAPAEPPETADEKSTEPEQYSDPLDDPATYARGGVPRFEREPEPDPEPH